MHRRFSRLPLALALTASLLGTSVATFAQTTTSQDKSQTGNTQSQPTATQTKKDLPVPSKAPNAKPLSTNEDPDMIGKRNLNKGLIIPKIAGSTEKEVKIGQQLAAEVDRQAKFIDDPVVTEYINRVGQNVVLHSDAKIPFTIKVIDSDEVNAFALPGGFFFVNKGLILAADNEAELAGVMAHEIAHVAARHAMENQGKMQAIQYGLLGTILFGGGIAAAVAQNAGGFAQMLSFLQFSRGAESEADVLGVQYLYASGYDPTAMSTMFEKLSQKNKKKPGTLSKIFSTHPQSIDRRDASLALVARFPEKEEYIISTSEFQRVKAHLLKITNARAGVVTDIDEEGNQKPTLKRRQPESTDPAGNDSGTSSSDGPPQLKKRGEEPAPSPSPNP